VPVKAITIRDPNEPQPAQASPVTKAEKAAEEDFMVHPTHDTGSIWYTVLSFLLPLLGLIAALGFKHFHHFRNQKACFKGAIAGLILQAAIVLIFLLLLWLVVV